MKKLKVLDLFSGIGGFSIGLERTGGFETVAFCEIEKFPQKVLNKHWPNVPIYEDVRELTSEGLQSDGIFPDIITGGFPCQDISVAGSQKGISEETRSGLWSECARLIGEIRPRYAVFENVTNLLNGNGGDWFKRVLWDISKIGYDAEWHCIPASSIGASHRRDRVWIVAYPKRISINERFKSTMFRGRQDQTEQVGMGCGEKNVPNTKSLPRDVRKSIEKSSKKNDGEFRGDSIERDIPNAYSTQRERVGLSIRIHQEHANAGSDSWWKVESSVDRVANGVRDVSHRLKALGNAVVPQIPELIGHAILERENKNVRRKATAATSRVPGTV